MKVYNLIVYSGVSRGTIYNIKHDRVKYNTELYYKIMYGEYTDRYEIAMSKMRTRLIMEDNLTQLAKEINVTPATLIGFKNKVNKGLQFEIFLALQCALGVAGRDL